MIGEPFSVRLEDARFVKRWRVSTSGEACRIVAFREVGARFDEWRRGVLLCRGCALREAETRVFYHRYYSADSIYASIQARRGHEIRAHAPMHAH